MTGEPDPVEETPAVPPEPPEGTRAAVARELSDARREASEYTADDIRSGRWFESLLRRALLSYCRRVDAAFFRDKYPGLNRDAIVDRRIELAQRYAAIAGGLSASAYSAAVAATIGSHGGASPIALPAALGSVTADLLFLSRLQLRLAYDLSVLYDQPIDLDDPEDLYDLVRVAFGAKAGEEFSGALLKLAPEATRRGVRYLATGGTLKAAQALPVVGRYLLQRNLLKMAIPGIAIPLSTGLNYVMTGRIANAARQIYRDKALSTELAGKLAPDAADDPLLFLEVVWLVCDADGKTSQQEAGFLHAAARALEQAGTAADDVARFSRMVDCDPDDVLGRLSGAPESLREAVYEAACVAAAIDHRIRPKEAILLGAIAGAAGVEFDRRHLEDLKERFGS